MRTEGALGACTVDDDVADKGDMSTCFVFHKIEHTMAHVLSQIRSEIA